MFNLFTSKDENHHIKKKNPEKRTFLTTQSLSGTTPCGVNVPGIKAYRPVLRCSPRDLHFVPGLPETKHKDYISGVTSPGHPHENDFVVRVAVPLNMVGVGFMGLLSSLLIFLVSQQQDTDSHPHCLAAV